MIHFLDAGLLLVQIVSTGFPAPEQRISDLYICGLTITTVGFQAGEVRGVHHISIPDFKKIVQVHEWKGKV
ncbi:MAG: hypothetical protein PHI64_18530 [Zoogloea sp.]|uniref:hypothetical protein n=1 Tax=Zoogloea sp. TaxID=49181 RepID=UPI00261E6CBB|nr:hypothetical protein [Zoogloea sp.]MDD2990938.1 hypothetical protein [Zoogloea sp.]